MQQSATMSQTQSGPLADQSRLHYRMRYQVQAARLLTATGTLQADDMPHEPATCRNITAAHPTVKALLCVSS